jgi:two-component system chemotaxis response regulator CheY
VRALVVDDSRAIRAVLRKMLTEIGFDVLEAGHGGEALICLKNAPPVDLVLVDWNMPEMNGLELVTALRGNRAYDAMRVMMVTTETEMENMSRALEAGANEYLMKPFTRDALQDKLHMLGMGGA